jgi:RNA polymerase sigma-70 factor (ECF subfamily)
VARATPRCEPLNHGFMMVDKGLTALRQLLVLRYDDLKRRLTRRFGSSDIAVEALHETWIRLEHLGEIAPVRRPESYLYRIATNLAVDRHRANVRWSDQASLEALLRSDDDQLDPERIVLMQSELAAFERVLREVPERRRAIFLAALIDELPYREIASRFGISLRSVEREMSLAFEHCGRRIDNFSIKRRVRASRNVLSLDKAPQRARGNDDDV